MIFSIKISMSLYRCHSFPQLEKCLVFIVGISSNGSLPPHSYKKIGPSSEAEEPVVPIPKADHGINERQRGGIYILLVWVSNLHDIVPELNAELLFAIDAFLDGFEIHLAENSVGIMSAIFVFSLITIGSKIAGVPVPARPRQHIGEWMHPEKKSTRVEQTRQCRATEKHPCNYRGPKVSKEQTSRNGTSPIVFHIASIS
mmetsp:Transcript_34868/g.84331  ORF Transcript_34868/g.84331 Transcript_34868/m.84331 type:complete len:200 (+) Transcript_34868:1925-2524(+)